MSSDDQSQLQEAKVRQQLLDLAGQTAPMRFSELARWYAQGKMLVIDKHCDLVELGCYFVNDHSAAIEPLIANGSIKPANDALARRWTEKDARLWALVVAPFVLAQEMPNAAEPLDSQAKPKRPSLDVTVAKVLNTYN